MSYPQGSTITKTNMISDFNSLVITARNNSVIWATGEGAWTAPSGTTGDPFYPNDPISGTYVSGDADPLGARTASSLATSALVDIVTASNILSAFVTTANAATNIRTVQLIKWYNNGGTYVNTWDYTRVGSMAAGYLSTVTTSSNPAAGAEVTASGLDSFVNSIVTSMNTIKTTALTFNEYYCHSSCHGSCHNSRGRR
jgi:hypothetical protein